jgi:steroid delta-isomerase-like uncharacterized protein
MTTDQRTVNKELVETFIQELFTKGDLGAVDRHLAPGFVNHDLPFPGAPDGPEGMRQAAFFYRAALPDWHSDVDQMIAEDDLVVERFTASGTHQGELMGVPGTGRAIVLRGINIFRIADGKIVERWGQLDQLGVLHQLGLAPA